MCVLGSRGHTLVVGRVLEEAYEHKGEHNAGDAKERLHGQLDHVGVELLVLGQRVQRGALVLARGAYGADDERGDGERDQQRHAHNDQHAPAQPYRQHRVHGLTHDQAAQDHLDYGVRRRLLHHQVRYGPLQFN